MGKAKSIMVHPIGSRDARKLVQKIHYSGKFVNNSQLHLGVFMDGRCGGVMQFGPSLDKRKIQGLVKGTPWNGFLELNRLAFEDWLPRNSESRALGFAFRWIRKTYPHIQWVVSFADAAQCGDGTIYRASGFCLTGIKRNNSIWRAPTGESFAETSLRPGIGGNRAIKRAEAIGRRTVTGGGNVGASGGGSSMNRFKEAGFAPIPGFQLRYVYFIDKSAKERLTVPILPFSKIDEMGAGMYKGEKRASKS